jgi:subtilisin family serine protease
MKLLILTFLALLGLVACAPLMKMAEKVDDEYIVVFHENITQTQQARHMSKLYALKSNTTYLMHTYSTVLKGYAARMTKEVLQSVLADPLVNYVEENGVVRALTCDTQSNAPSWGIKRIWLPAPQTGNTLFKYPDAAGSGVTSYILDTGIYVANNDFQGRASFGYKSDASWSNTDGNGHGTHVASTVGGITYGVAKKCTLIAVKVLGDNGSGTWAGVIDGVDWVAKNAQGKLATGNMSLGGGFSAAVNTAVDNCVKAGVILAVAAGNNNANAANYSPASAEQPITVGATAETNNGGQTTDTRSSFSNYGTIVDVFAPGTSITAAWIGNPTAINTISGTSMASPHVCGVATTLLSLGVPVNQVKSTITSTAKTGLINMSCGTVAACQQTPNRMLFQDPTC